MKLSKFCNGVAPDVIAPLIEINDTFAAELQTTAYVLTIGVGSTIPPGADTVCESFAGESEPPIVQYPETLAVKVMFWSVASAAAVANIDPAETRARIENRRIQLFPLPANTAGFHFVECQCQTNRETTVLLGPTGLGNSMTEWS
jgi:hypothetical protein